MAIGDWERASGRAWPWSGHVPLWPDDYPATCDCNPPGHTLEQIARDESFHARTRPEHSAHSRRIYPAREG